MTHLLLHVFGLDGTSAWSAFWQGPAGCLGYVSVFGIFYRKHNCHVRRCWRLGHHLVNGWVVCHVHRSDGTSELPHHADCHSD